MALAALCCAALMALRLCGTAGHRHSSTFSNRSHNRAKKPKPGLLCRLQACACCKPSAGGSWPHSNSPEQTLEVRSAPFLAGAASFLRLSPDGIWPLAFLSAATRASKSVSVCARSPSAAAAVCWFRALQQACRGWWLSQEDWLSPAGALRRLPCKSAGLAEHCPCPTRARSRRCIRPTSAFRTFPSGKHCCAWQC